MLSLVPLEEDVDRTVEEVQQGEENQREFWELAARLLAIGHLSGVQRLVSALFARINKVESRSRTV